MRNENRNLVKGCGAAALLLVALSGCASSSEASAPAGSSGDVAAPVQSTSVWEIPIYSSEGGCSGSVTVAGSPDWALLEGRLTRAGGAELQAFCDNSERYADYVTSWELSSVLESVYPDGNCRDAPATNLSGHPGVRCEYEYDGTYFIYSIGLIGDRFVQVGGGVIGDESTRSEVSAMLDSLELTIT